MSRLLDIEDALIAGDIEVPDPDERGTVMMVATLAALPPANPSDAAEVDVPFDPPAL